MLLYREIVRQAASALVAHRFRAGLTMLGIAWGIVTVVLLMAYGNGFQRALTNGFRNAFSERHRPHRQRPDQPAGRRRAGRAARLPRRKRTRPRSQELGFIKYVESRVHAVAGDRLRHPPDDRGRARRGPGVRADARRDGRDRPVPQCRGRREPAPRLLPGVHGRREAVRRHSRRSARPCASAGSRSMSSA